jgi:hypothetical protein
MATRGHNGASTATPSGFELDLRKVDATTAYKVEITLHKIQYFGDWSTESSVLLDYIDPTVLA